MTDVKIAVCHTETEIRDEVRAAWWWRPYDVEYVLTTKASPFSYAEQLRRLWRLEGCDLVICEQDVVPPQGSPHGMLTCPEPWCTHPHPVGDHAVHDSLGLTKFSAKLRACLLGLMDDVVCQPDPRYWVRRGWTRLDRDCSVATLNSAGRRATITSHSAEFHKITPSSQWLTTHDWMAIDTDLARALMNQGFKPHVHQPPTIHLHDYTAHPKNAHVPWQERPYDPAEWP